MPTTARQPSSRRERPMAPVVMHYGCGTSRDDLDTGDVKLCTWSVGYEEVDERRPQVAHRRVSCDRLCCGSFPRLCTMCVCAVVCLRDLWIDCMDRSFMRSSHHQQEHRQKSYAREQQRRCVPTSHYHTKHCHAAVVSPIHSQHTHTQTVTPSTRHSHLAGPLAHITPAESTTCGLQSPPRGWPLPRCRRARRPGPIRPPGGS